MFEKGFALVVPNPYTVITTAHQKYQRSLKETLTPDEFIQKRGLYPDLEIIVNNGLFEVYENISDGSEKIETKHLLQ